MEDTTEERAPGDSPSAPAKVKVNIPGSWQVSDSPNPNKKHFMCGEIIEGRFLTPFVVHTVLSKEMFMSDGRRIPVAELVAGAFTSGQVRAAEEFGKKIGLHTRAA